MSFNNTTTPTKPTTPAKWQVPMRQHSGMSVMEYYLEGELKERFCKLFPKNSNRRMMTWFGISFSTVQRFKREFGLEKDIQAVRKQQAKDIKKVLLQGWRYSLQTSARRSILSVLRRRLYRKWIFGTINAFVELEV